MPIEIPVVTRKRATPRAELPLGASSDRFCAVLARTEGAESTTSREIFTARFHRKRNGIEQLDDDRIRPIDANEHRTGVSRSLTFRGEIPRVSSTPIPVFVIRFLGGT